MRAGKKEGAVRTAAHYPDPRGWAVSSSGEYGSQGSQDDPSGGGDEGEASPPPSIWDHVGKRGGSKRVEVVQLVSQTLRHHQSSDSHSEPPTGGMTTLLHSIPFEYLLYKWHLHGTEREFKDARYFIRNASNKQ